MSEYQHVEYIGPEPELLGKTFLALPVNGSQESIRVQSNDPQLIYKRQRLGLHWHCMPSAHFKVLGSSE